MPDRLSIAFQGTKAGLVIAIDETLPQQSVLSDLSKKLEESGYFFVGAEVTLQLGNRSLAAKELEQLLATIGGQHGMRVTSVKTSSSETQQAAEEVGLPVQLGSEKPAAAPAPRQRSAARPASRRTQRETLPTELLRRTVRSGQIYESPGHLVILGDVNAGAEVVAAGDIVVFGALRGIAFAGATGRQESIIVALKLAPMQIRIAGRVARATDEGHEHNGPEYACVDGEQIVIDKWTALYGTAAQKRRAPVPEHYPRP